MKRNDRLFWNALLISCKHSGRRLLCLLCVLAACGGLLAAYFAAPRAQGPARKALVGIVNLDENPLSVAMLNSLLEGENLSDLLEVKLLPPDGRGREACTAVLTVPAGFLESVLTGENLPPLLELNLTSPLEAMWVRQVALAGARALSSAQLGIYAVLEAADYGADMTADEYNLLITDVNLEMLQAFFDRLTLLSEERLSASGALTLPQYYAAALAAALLFCYGFLFYPAMRDLRRFARAAGRGRAALFCAGALHIVLLEAAVTLPLILLFTGGKLAAGPWLLLTALSATAALLCTQLFPGRAACAAACLLLTLGQALCGGLLAPLALLPQGFSAAAPLLPVRQAMELLASCMGEPLAPAVPAVMCLLLAAASALLWMRKGERR